jgi:hypothetical protein
MGLFEPPAVVGWETRAQHVVGQLQGHLSDLGLRGHLGPPAGKR